MSSFPSTIATLTNPLPTQQLNSPSHSSIESAQNNEIIQIETVVGVVGATSVVGTLSTAVFSPGSNGGGHVQTAAVGGTGQTTFNQGDILYASNSSTLSRLGIGSPTAVLTVNPAGTAPEWAGGGGLNLPAATSILGGTGVIPVYIDPFQSDGGIKLDAVASVAGGISIGTGSGSVLNSVSFVVASVGGSSYANRALVALISNFVPSGGSTGIVSFGQSVIGSVYGSVMTQVGVASGLASTNLYNWRAYYLNNPSIGQQNLYIYQNKGASNSTTLYPIIYSFYNVAQSGQPEVSVMGSSTSESITPLSNGDIILGFGDTNSSIASLPNNPQIITGGQTQSGSGVSGINIPASTQSISLVYPETSTGATIALALAPFTSPQFTIAPASASSSVTSATYVGFTTSSVASSAIGTVTTNGLVQGLSSLMTGGVYYLGNTPGTISTTPGTINKKVGTAVSSVALLLTNT